MTAADRELIELRIGAIAHGGHCVARHGGRVVFVRHTLPGELVRARLTDAAEGASYWRADAVEVIEPSADRVPHAWAQADALHRKLPVGGAEFGHISRAGQRRLKADVLAEQLRRLAGLDPDSPFLDTDVEDVDAAGQPGQAAGFGWRTRAGFSVTAAGKLGMHAHRSATVLAVTRMPLAADAINDLHLAEADLTGIVRVEVAAPANGSRPLVLLAPDPALDAKAAGRAVKRAAAGLPADASVAGWDPESGAVDAVRGRSWVQESASGHEFRVTGDGFWQIHRRAPEVLTGAVLGYLADGHLPAGVAVADLYAGAGLFTAALADAVGPAGVVLSVEGSPGASRDARKNLHAAGQVRIASGRVEKVLGGELRAGHRFGTLVLDPPRAGAGKAVVAQLADSGARAIAYVSCDPASFARDLGYFRRRGWDLAQLRAFDLYPHTHHLETVALLLPNAVGHPPNAG
ncbi:MAG: class I SAM-dependent RNA methyltransferase [Actinomycetales bacterium]